MRRFIVDAILTILLLVIAAWIAGYFLVRNGLSASAQPPWIEDVLAERARALAIPASAKAVPNPLEGSADAWRAGGRHFEEECAICHGDNGRGQTEIGRNLYPKAPDMTGDTQDLSDGTLFYIIENGIRYTGMPAWAGDHTPEESWQLVSFSRRLPRLTPAEIEQLKAGGGVKSEGGTAPEHEEQSGAEPASAQPPAAGKRQPGS
jgi:mono/diheme cytochrome c family protein